MSLTVALNLVFGDRVSRGTQISSVGCLETSNLPVSAFSVLVLQSCVAMPGFYICARDLNCGYF